MMVHSNAMTCHDMTCYMTLHASYGRHSTFGFEGRILRSVGHPIATRARHERAAQVHTYRIVKTDVNLGDGLEAPECEIVV